MIDTKLTRGVNLIFNLLFLNFVYFFLILLGLGILGFFPATVALIATISNRRGKNWKELLQLMWMNYKSLFIRVNVHSFLLLILLTGDLLNIWLCWQQNSPFFYVLSSFLTLITIILLMSILNWIVIKSWEIWILKNRMIDYLYFVITVLPIVVVQLVILGIYIKCLTILPVLFIFGGTSITVVLFSKLTEKALNKISSYPNQISK